jgi:hypothetical protein
MSTLGQGDGAELSIFRLFEVGEDCENPYREKGVCDHLGMCRCLVGDESEYTFARRKICEMIGVNFTAEKKVRFDVVGLRVALFKEC